MPRYGSRLASVLLLLVGLAGFAEEVSQLDDDFSAYRAGLFSSVVGAHMEYHYLPQAAAKGNWSVSTFRSSVPSQRAWRIVDHNDEAAMAQMYTNKYSFYHPMLVTGDVAWRDYTVSVRFVDTNQTRCHLARKVQGVETVCQSALEDEVFGESAEVGFRRALIMTPNDALNTLIVQQARAFFNHGCVYRVYSQAPVSTEGGNDENGHHLAFHKDFYLIDAEKMLSQGEAYITVMQSDEAPEGAIPLMRITEAGVRIIKAEDSDLEGRLLWFVPGTPPATPI